MNDKVDENKCLLWSKFCEFVSKMMAKDFLERKKEEYDDEMLYLLEREENNDEML